MRAIGQIIKFDVAFSLFCLQHRFSQPVAQLSKAISHTGDGHLYAVLGGIAWWLEPIHGSFFLIAGLIAFAIELPIYWALKNSFQRRRPEEFSSSFTAFITPSDRYSLPSGHTAAGFVIATLIGHYYPHSYDFAITWACLIGASRILLGVHFLTDIVIGAVLGVSSVHIALWLVERTV
ncbi:phosphatase PAP2 family protein [Vibrio aestuarianus]|uniref:phosphatase PAP2 family protein n=1 Tax=Vibrio aestuarianus TaxID=28171 RepID=UPI0015589085|nr:phosphatase PAP2 family protein [Vibrio aestuarianus]NGZ13129.1 phosphatase PAP2 family protein [Vibrio aestuarianus]NKZ49277.1 phosphatase PAP2 family protein [Vibrio aestuarianus]